MRISCLSGKDIVIDYEQYTREISPFAIYKMEEDIIRKKKVFILSAFPEFLLDYFGIRLWKICVKRKGNLLNCQQRISSIY